MTGEIDMDLIATGQSHASTERVINVKLIVKKIYVSIKKFSYNLSLGGSQRKGYENRAYL